MQACKLLLLVTSLTNTQTAGPPRLTVTSALSGLSFVIFVFFLLCLFSLSSTFGNTHTEELSPNVATQEQPSSPITPVIGSLEVP